jgi:hypothetical protein
MAICPIDHQLVSDAVMPDSSDPTRPVDNPPAEQLGPDGEPLPGTPAANDLLVRDKHGDPLPDAKSVLMTEFESYERIIEGLKIAADAAVHVAKNEPDTIARDRWIKAALYLDQVRRAACQQAGLRDPLQQNVTERVRGRPLPWSMARDRFRYGCTQAAGGFRQMATCHRANVSWSRGAKELEDMARDTLVIANRHGRIAPLIMPGRLGKDGMVRY